MRACAGVVRVPPVTWKLSGRLSARPAAVFAWMTDFREDDHNSEAYHRGAKTPEKERARAAHRVIDVEGATLKIHDEWGTSRFDARVTVDGDAREVRIEGEFGYSSVWRAVEDGSGTRVETEGRVAPKGPGKLFLPFIGKGLMAGIERDFNGHMEEMRVDLEGAK